MFAVANLVLYPLATTAARADVAGAMDGYFNDMGAAANVTGPSAYQGQEAGYYSGGNVWTRFPQKNVSLANIQLPKVTAGCGGIDVFAGSFSFINSAQMISLLKSIANNSLGFAFKLAIDTVCPECSKVMEEISQKLQLMNNLQINSCQAAAALVGSVWPKSETADREICQQFGNSSGKFSDMAASMAGCGNGGSRKPTLAAAAADPNMKDVAAMSVPINFTWHMMEKSDFFAPGGTMDTSLAQYVMTMVGTIIYVPPGDDDPGVYNTIAGDVSSTLVTALLDGTDTTGAIKVWTCDTPDPCVAPTLQPIAFAANKAIRFRVKTLIEDMASKMQTDTALTAPEIALLQVASLPLYKILAVQAAAGRGASIGSDSDTLAEITSIDLLTSVLDQLMSEIGKTRSSLSAADGVKAEAWQTNFVATRTALAQRQANTQAKVSALMQIIQKTAFLESTLAAQMTPAMSASVDWSRQVGAHGIVN
ncbi:conjugal transfer protein TraH (plasmid) [Polymorphobacter sp. PAMC 29334]|uniref:conjugal transfer protein TraH n=1 Tax=Polymorphobacter sp. PAMC 29334 TaxID=2862331 RepID=UPI001C667F2B|nr:conjugal transfer protein TraH [Polymorphobacter sp. PAMC 29334]QYE37287.1 conjugal transfer protein TraH [Polymorphobacter sp. PAMC 29334]